MYKQTTTLEQAFSMVYRAIVMDWFHFNTFLSDCTIIRCLKDNLITDMVVAMEALYLQDQLQCPCHLPTEIDSGKVGEVM